jgi:hypothetical protein
VYACSNAYPPIPILVFIDASGHVEDNKGKRETENYKNPLFMCHIFKRVGSRYKLLVPKHL